MITCTCMMKRSFSDLNTVIFALYDKLQVIVNLHVLLDDLFLLHESVDIHVHGISHSSTSACRSFNIFFLKQYNI